MKVTEPFKLVGHSHQIADTGDYDGVYEITDGRISIYSQDDDDEALQQVVDAMNDSGCRFYLDDSKAYELHLLKEQLNVSDEKIKTLSLLTSKQVFNRKLTQQELTFYSRAFVYAAKMIRDGIPFELNELIEGDNEI